MIKHFAAQPFAEGIKPGMQMGPWGLHYERTNTWWEFSEPWHEYLARCQYLLRQGSFVADVLKLESEEPLHRFENFTLSGYDYDACGPATFLRGSVRDGQLIFPSGIQYRLIVLPDSPTMTVGLLSHIRALVQAGAAILGDPPLRTPGLTDYPKADGDLKKLADEIWGSDASVTERTLGSGHVFRGIKAEQALAVLSISPDFTNDADLKYIHHTVDGSEVYFLSHPGNVPTPVNCTFRLAGKVPELWDPQTGHISPLPAYSVAEQKLTTLSIPFQPNGSAFVIFKADSTSPQPIVSITRDGIPLLEKGRSPTTAPSTFDPVNSEVSQGGTYVFTSADGSTHQTIVASLPDPLIVTGPWQLRFPTGWGAPPEVKLDELISWSNHPDDGVKYFSGTATYSKNLTVPALNANQRFYLDLGKVQVMAKVRLNGKDLGILWKSPYRVDITSAIKAGDNALEIDVVNTWVNRLIGDEQLSEDSDRNKNGTLKSWPQWLQDGKPSPAGRLTFSSWRLWKKSDPLQQSGLIGPVTLQVVQHI